MTSALWPWVQSKAIELTRLDQRLGSPSYHHATYFCGSFCKSGLCTDTSDMYARLHLLCLIVTSLDDTLTKFFFFTLCTLKEPNN